MQGVKTEPNTKRDRSDDEEDVKPFKKAKTPKKKIIGKTTIDLTEEDEEDAPVISLE